MSSISFELIASHSDLTFYSPSLSLTDAAISIHIVTASERAAKEQQHFRILGHDFGMKRKLSILNQRFK